MRKCNVLKGHAYITVDLKVQGEKTTVKGEKKQGEEENVKREVMRIRDQGFDLTGDVEK